MSGTRSRALSSVVSESLKSRYRLICPSLDSNECKEQRLLLVATMERISFMPICVPYRVHSIVAC